MIRILFFISFCIFLQPLNSASAKPIIEVMAPLLIVAPTEPKWQTHPGWKQFDKELREAKSLGVSAVTVDVWWGIVQRDGEEFFDWSYYDKIFHIIKGVGLRIVPVLAIHACGGNVGDTINIPLPEWVRRRMPKMAGGLDARYLSEAGNWSEEVISVWATEFAMPYYKKFWHRFLTHFSDDAFHIRKLIVGVGPAGELLYPSYHSHDQIAGFEAASFPNRGSLQASSPLAQENFRNYLKDKYDENILSLNNAWGTHYSNFSDIEILKTSGEVENFFKKHLQYSQKGQDFFSWYRQSLFRHAHKLLLEFSKISHGDDFHYKHASIGFKIPGIYWDHGERRPELTAGLIATVGSRNDLNLSPFQRQPKTWTASEQNGYRPLFMTIVRQLKKERPHVRWVGIFSCGELQNQERFSRAFDLVLGIGELSKEFKIPFYLENALASNLYTQSAFDVFYQHLRYSGFAGLSLLRLHEALHSQLSRRFIRHTSPENFPNVCDELLGN